MDVFVIFQNFRISESERLSGEAKGKAVNNEIDIRAMRDQIDHLSLVSKAMCELLAEIGFDQSMLEAKIREIDLRDGKLDGKLEQTKTCQDCSRVLAMRHVRCLYCGATV